MRTVNDSDDRDDDSDLAGQTRTPHPGLADQLGVEADTEAVYGGLEGGDQLLADVGRGGRGGGGHLDTEAAVAKLLHHQADLEREVSHLILSYQVLPCAGWSGEKSDCDKKVLEVFDTVLSFGTICTLSKSGNERENLESMSYRFSKFNIACVAFGASLCTYLAEWV